MASDKTASATVPINEEIQRFAIDLDEQGGAWMLPFLSEFADCFETIRESGDEGVETKLLDKESELPVRRFFEDLAHNRGGFEETNRADTIRIAQNRSGSGVSGI